MNNRESTAEQEAGRASQSDQGQPRETMAGQEEHRESQSDQGPRRGSTAGTVTQRSNSGRTTGHRLTFTVKKGSIIGESKTSRESVSFEHTEIHITGRKGLSKPI